MSQIALNAQADKSMQHQDDMDFTLSSSQKYIHIFPPDATGSLVLVQVEASS